MNCSRPAPDPVGLYSTFLPGQYWPHVWLNTAIAFCWAVDPSAITVFFPPQPAVPAGPTAGDGAGMRLSSLPHADSTPAPVTHANAKANALNTLSSLTAPASRTA